VVAVRTGELRGLRQRLLTIDVDQHVKGALPKEIVVWTPSGTSCDLSPKPHKAIGLFLTRSPDGRWVATAASRVNPGELVVTGGEPRGGSIKIVVGLVFLVIVLLWALSRRRRGVRPELPGPPPQ
jgi:MYXO-CTERM domain-containing protein